jgi:hypothetical protein
MNIAAKSAHPCLGALVIRPNVHVKAAGIARISSISHKFVSGVGFSNGWAEFALKNPPPSELSSLIGS